MDAGRLRRVLNKPAVERLAVRQEAGPSTRCASAVARSSATAGAILTPSASGRVLGSALSSRSSRAVWRRRGHPRVYCRWRRDQSVAPGFHARPEVRGRRTAIRRQPAKQRASTRTGSGSRLSQPLLRLVLQGPLDQRHPFGEPVSLPAFIPLIEDEPGGMLAATDTDDIAHKRQRGSLCGVRRTTLPVSRRRSSNTTLRHRCTVQASASTRPGVLGRAGAAPVRLDPCRHAEQHGSRPMRSGVPDPRANAALDGHGSGVRRGWAPHWWIKCAPPWHTNCLPPRRGPRWTCRSPTSWSRMTHSSASCRPSSCQRVTN